MARVLISMPESFLGKIDEVAENESRSRSELIREALRSYITKSRVRQNTLADKNARFRGATGLVKFLKAICQEEAAEIGKRRYG